MYLRFPFSSRPWKMRTTQVFSPRLIICPAIYLPFFLGEHLCVLEGKELVSGRSLSEEMQSFEHDAIKRALENAQGSVTNAARSLGMSYQALAYMLETRHKDLRKKRTPARRRPRKG